MRPPEIERLMGLLSDVCAACDRLYQQWSKVEHRLATQGGNLPHGFSEHYTEPPDDAPADWQRPESTAAEPDQYRWWTAALDSLTLAVRQWRNAIDTARQAAPNAAPWMDDSSKPPVDRWTTKCIDLLQQLGGLIHRHLEGDCPLLGTDRYEQLPSFSQRVLDRINELRPIHAAPLQPSDTNRQTGSDGGKAEDEPPADDSGQGAGTVPEHEKKMKPAIARAGASLEWVRQESPELAPDAGSGQRYCREQYDYIREHGYSEYLDEHGKSSLPDWHAWSRYVREYLRLTEGQRNSPRAGRSGRSIVPPNEIDPSRHGDE